MTPSRTTSLVTSFLVALLVAGCNVYEGLFEEGQSNNPEALLQDAEIALQQDRPEEAAAFLQRALDQNPADPPLRKRIQIKLASALLLSEDLDVLILTRLARTFNGETTNKAPRVLLPQTTQVCTFPETHTRALFDPEEGIDLERLGAEASQEALDESQALIAAVLEGEVEKTDLTLPCEDEQAFDDAIAGLQAEGLTNEEIAEALVNFAVSLAIDAYHDVIEAGGEDASFFYVTPPLEGPDYIGLCFSGESTCNTTITQTAEHLPSLGCVALVLQKRATLLHSDTAQELADLAHDSYIRMEDGLANTSCIVY